MLTAKQTWSNVPGTFPVELFIADGEVCDADDVVPEILWPFVMEDGCELIIEFRSSGYYDPGRTYGDPDDCYPPEGDDERLVDEVYLFLDNEKIKLPRAILVTSHNPHSVEEIDLWDELFEHYSEAIQEVELDTDDDPRY